MLGAFSGSFSSIGVLACDLITKIKKEFFEDIIGFLRGSVTATAESLEQIRSEERTCEAPREESR